MAASSDRTQLQGIYTDMVIGEDTETPAQRVNVTWGDDNTPLNRDLTNEQLDKQNIIIELLSEQLTQMKIFNAYMAKGFDFVLTEEDTENAD